MRGFIQLNAWGTSADKNRRQSTGKGKAMADISLEAVAGKLNRVGYEAFFKALRQAKGAGNRNVELAHWLAHILQGERSDIGLTADHFKLDRGKLMTDVTAVVNGFRKNETEMPAVSNTVMDLLDRGWHYATLFFGETQIRTGHLLVGALQSRELTRTLVERDLRVRYKQTVLGFGWSVVGPVTFMLVFTLFFSRAGHINTGGVPYPLFSYVALVPWSFFSEAVTVGSISLILLDLPGEVRQ